MSAYTDENCDMEAVEEEKATHIRGLKELGLCTYVDGEAVAGILLTIIKRWQRPQDYIVLAKKSSQGEDF